MIKKIVGGFMLVFLLTACQPADKETTSQMNQDQVVAADTNSNQAPLEPASGSNNGNNTEQVSTETNDDSPEEEKMGAGLKPDGTRQAWTRYEQYAQADSEGYAYYMFDDPDVSSEIFPLATDGFKEVLLFTFDDAPQMPEPYTLEIAKTLKEKDVNAIFLVNGMYLESEEGRNIVKQIYDMGFEVGNHTQTHPHLRDLTYEEQWAEINQTSEMVAEITGEKPRWFRPPFGEFNMDTINICNDLGMQLMTWNFGYDWMDEYLDAGPLAEVSLNNDYLHAGANILMHDRSWTAEAIAQMVDGYREQGYQIVDPLLIRSQKNSTAPLVQ